MGAGPRLGLVLVAWLSSSAAARELPSAELSLDSEAVVLGDPVQLRLRLRPSPGGTALAPPLDSLLAPHAVGPVEVKSGAGAAERMYAVELRFYELGIQRIPSMEIAFPRASGDTLWRHTQALQIDVGGVRGPGDTELRGIRGPRPISGGVPTWLIVATGIAVLLALAARRLLWRRQSPDAPTPLPPLDYAAEFARIAAMGLIERGAFKSYYSLLSETLRRFMEERLGVPALDRTTREIAAALRTTDLVDAALAGRVLDLLRQADLAKFARAIPPSKVARQAAEQGQLLVVTVEERLASRLAAETSIASTASGEIAVR